ncbi:MAG: FliA/WhiG family RNA polymerase sigma factor [Planctomycetota bacterium]|nr:FliA/WhiG family RNA polymerase sigma factor [Planctomycetota bacterium]
MPKPNSRNAQVEGTGALKRTPKMSTRPARDVPPPIPVVEDAVLPITPAGMTPEIVELWRNYRAASDAGATSSDGFRNRLIETYLHVVRFAAERARAKLPAEVEVDDLFQAGLFGLMDSINSYDIDRGIKFETFADRRIHGAIMDQLRSLDWVPRLVRNRTARVDRAKKEYQSLNGRVPSEEELREHLGVSAEEFEKVQRDSSPVGVTSLHRKWQDSDSGKDSAQGDVIEDVRQRDPFSAVQSSDLLALFTKGLSRAESLIVILYYYEEMTMKEIGMTLDLSESRVSQMHTSILARLKAQMAHRMKDIK